METVNDTIPPTDPPPPYRDPARRLTRSTDDKVVSGLAGGLGRYFGIDPVVFRIAFVVLTLAGGSGILLYLVGWLMVPDDRGGTVLHRVGGDRNQKLVAAVVAGLGLLLLLDNVFGSNGDVPVGLVLVGLGGLYLWSRRNPPPTPPTGDTEGPVGTINFSATDAVVSEPPPPPPPAERKSRSALVPITLSLLAVLAGGLSLVGVSATTGLALALLLTGGALIVGAWRGRARWLIPIGLLLSVALAAASVVDVPVPGNSGDVSYRPLSVAEIRTPYRIAAGELILDLGALDLAGQTVTIVASVAAGHLDIVVPRDVAVEVDAHVGAGKLALLGRESDGFDVGRQVVEPGPEGAGRLVLRPRAGFGMVEVRRAVS